MVANSPLPYHTPILNQLAARVDLRVIYMSRTHPLAGGGPDSGAHVEAWGEPPRFRHEFHRSVAVRSLRTDFRTQLSFGVSARLERARPDVVLFSSWGPLMLEPLAWRLVRRRRTVMWAESTASSGLLRGRLSQLARREILKRVDGFVANGTQAADFLDGMGVARERVIVSCLPSALRLPASEAAESGTASVRRFIFVGRLVARKRPLELIAAFRSMLADVPDAHLTIVGNGPLMEEARQAAASAGGSITFLGRQEGPDLADALLQADALVLPAVREVWGLVVNEALAAGLFVIATDEVGSAHDLLDPTSGAILPADDPEVLRAALIDAAHTQRADGSARTERARRVRHCTPDAFAAAIERAAYVAMRGAT
jgi:glycosyltransferase involved in cell wall biosynthesis